MPSQRLCQLFVHILQNIPNPLTSQTLVKVRVSKSVRQCAGQSVSHRPSGLSRTACLPSAVRSRCDGVGGSVSPSVSQCVSQSVSQSVSHRPSGLSRTACLPSAGRSRCDSKLATATEGGVSRPH